MAVDILSVSALNRTVEAKRLQVQEKQNCRDSAQQAVLADSAIMDSYDKLIDSLDSYISNYSAGGYGFTMDCYHAKYYGSGGEGHGGELFQKYKGIKRLCHYGSISSHISIANTTTRYNCGVCCCITVPAGSTYMGVTMTAPGGPGKMANCCGWGGAGPYGHFASFILKNVVAGDVFAFCAGCSNECFPYCCGYNLSTSEPTSMCSISGTYGTQALVCLTSPNPYYCVEDKNRKFNMQFGRCASTTNNLSGPYCCQGCCCYAYYWAGLQCMCNECGTSGCSNGNDWGCFQFNECSQENNTNLCYGEMPYQDDRMGPSGQAYCNSQCGDCMPYFATAITSGIVPGSCFAVKGGWPGGRSRNNCWMQYLPPHPYGTSVLGLDCGCRICWTNCCPGCIYSANQAQRCVPGMGGSPTLACGGGTGLYADIGRMGAVCIQFC